jgi:hypothetical protein
MITLKRYSVNRYFYSTSIERKEGGFERKLRKEKKTKG